MNGGRLLVANLDAETSWARLAAAPRWRDGAAAVSPRDPRFALPEDVLLRCAALGTLLRCAAEAGDRLWTVRPVDPQRVPDVAGLARPELVSGARSLTEAVEGLRWADEGAAAAAANDRTFALGVAQDLGVALPGACVVATAAQILAALPEGPWVLKAPHASAGRSRLRGRGRSPAEEALRRAENLLALHGRLVLEPWLPRTADLGIAATVGSRGAEDVSIHRQRVDAGGAFESIEVPAGLRPGEEEVLRRTADEVASRLAALGYGGPFGIDAWRWRGEDGRERLHPLGEVNARWTFGRVARETAHRVLPGADAWTFGVGAAPAGAVTLLRAARPDGIGAHLARGAGPDRGADDVSSSATHPTR